MTVVLTEFMKQSPTLSLHEIADLLWQHGEFAAYRSLKAYIAERDQLLKEIGNAPADQTPAH